MLGHTTLREKGNLAETHRNIDRLSHPAAGERRDHGCCGAPTDRQAACQGCPGRRRYPYNPSLDPDPENTSKPWANRVRSRFQSEQGNRISFVSESSFASPCERVPALRSRSVVPEVMAPKGSGRPSDHHPLCGRLRGRVPTQAGCGEVSPRPSGKAGPVWSQPAPGKDPPRRVRTLC